LTDRCGEPAPAAGPSFARPRGAARTARICTQ
jgi:hypothetical protein